MAVILRLVAVLVAVFFLAGPGDGAPPAAKDRERLPDERGEQLYNGIRLPRQWPPDYPSKDLKSLRTPRKPPYLVAPPAVIPIDVGRQLFVDDFLIETTNLTRSYHRPQKYEKNPILKPETPLELAGGKNPCATLFNDGVCFDPRDRLFKMWYHAGWFDGTAYATSPDGLRWTRPQLDIVPGTNRVLPKNGHGARDTTAVWLDPFARDPAARFKMFVYERPEEHFGGRILISPDGTHWSDVARTPPVGDNTTIFYNPFRRKWVYSIRSYHFGRVRRYREHDDLVQGAQWGPNDTVHWVAVDELDRPDPRITSRMPSLDKIRAEAERTGKNVEEYLATVRFDYGDPPQIYNVDAVAYESLMLGVFNILRGPHNRICKAAKSPKITELEVGYSRDGFHWHRPDRSAFLGATMKKGDWDRAYLHPAATICAVMGDRLYFYFGAWSGENANDGDMYAGGATGVAFLRRDGFASMDAGPTAGSLTTRPLTFKGKHLFVNLDAPQGELRVEALDEAGKVLAPFSAENCVPVIADKTRQAVHWKGAGDLSDLAGKKVKFRFTLRAGRLYAFWVTPDVRGASFGYVAAGGPEFNGPVDDGPFAGTVPAFDVKTAASTTIDRKKFNEELRPEKVALQQHYRQPLRPQFHYTPIQGHFGDATGLIFYKGEYHLFSMYDEWELRRNKHKRWGHAISKDLIHWKQMPAILDTTRDSHPGSGGGCVDWNNSSGLQQGPEKTLLVFYTDYRQGTCVAYSNDAGRTWKYYDHNSVLPDANDKRDPLVFWHEPTSRWSMLRYENRGFAIYGSTDLLHWNHLSRVEDASSSKGLYECPDLFEVPVENRPGVKKWVLVDGNGQYFVGHFDGKAFLPESKRATVVSGDFYAPQTWKRPGCLPVQVAWQMYALNPITANLTWNGECAFPCELSLVDCDGTARLRRQPIPALQTLYDASRSITLHDLSTLEKKNPLAGIAASTCELILEIGSIEGQGFTLQIGDVPVRVDVGKRTVECLGKKATIPGTANSMHLQILVDRSSLEIFVDHGLACLNRTCFPLGGANKRLAVVPEEGAVIKIKMLKVNYLKSIWADR